MRPADTSARTAEMGAGLLVDFASDGRPLGIEILAPGQVSAQAINQVLRRLKMGPLPETELAPVAWCDSRSGG